MTLFHSQCIQIYLEKCCFCDVHFTMLYKYCFVLLSFFYVFLTSNNITHQNYLIFKQSILTQIGVLVYTSLSVFKYVLLRKHSNNDCVEGFLQSSKISGWSLLTKFFLALSGTGALITQESSVKSVVLCRCWIINLMILNSSQDARGSGHYRVIRASPPVDFSRMLSAAAFLPASRSPLPKSSWIPRYIYLIFISQSVSYL